MNCTKRIAAIEALEELKALVDYITRIDYVPQETRNEVKQLLTDAYEKSNGLFDIIKEGLQIEEDDHWEDFDWCYECTGYGDDYSVGDDGELHSNCENCPHNKKDEDRE